MVAKGGEGSCPVLRNQIKGPSLSLAISSFFGHFRFGPSAAILRTPINLLRQFGKGRAAQESRNFVYSFFPLILFLLLLYILFFGGAHLAPKATAQNLKRS